MIEANRSYVRWTGGVRNAAMPAGESIPRRVLVIKASALGDVVHALPVLPYIRSVDPNIRIGWVVEEPFTPILQDHPMIDRLHVLRTKTWRRTPLAADTRRDVARFVGDLRAGNYDLVLDVQGNSKSGAIALVTGAGARYGLDRGTVREWLNLLSSNHKVVCRPQEDYHVSECALRVAATALPGGVLPTAPGPLAVIEANRIRIEHVFTELGISGGKTALFHYGAGWETKLWDLACWKELGGEAIRRMGLAVILTWGNEAELAACRRIRRATDGSAIIWPRCHLREIMALLDRVDLVVGGDTGLVHMAAALGTPTVSLYLASHGLRSGPRGENDRCLQSSMKCSPCFKRVCPRNDYCGKSISVGEVLDAMEAVMSIGRESAGLKPEV